MFSSCVVQKLIQMLILKVIYLRFVMIYLTLTIPVLKSLATPPHTQLKQRPQSHSTHHSANRINNSTSYSSCFQQFCLMKFSHLEGFCVNVVSRRISWGKAHLPSTSLSFINPPGANTN